MRTFDSLATISSCFRIVVDVVVADVVAHDSIRTDYGSMHSKTLKIHRTYVFEKLFSIKIFVDIIILNFFLAFPIFAQRSRLLI